MARFFTEPKIASFLSKLAGFLSPYGIEVYLVGGYVRDGLMRRATGDIDLAISAEALPTGHRIAEALGGRFVLLDDVNNIVRVVFPKEEWHIDLSTLRGTIEEDLAHRDFTIDAIAIKLEQLDSGWSEVQLIDPSGGFGDIERRSLRAVGDSIFEDDPLRLLRAVRLEAELGFTIEGATESLLKGQCHLISTVSGERIRDELCRILATDKAYSSLCHLEQMGLLTQVIHELIPAKGATQPKEHYWDVFQHSLATVEAVERLLGSQDREQDEVLSSVPWSPQLAQHFEQEGAPGRNRKALFKLAALLHDIAKPQAKSIEESGKVRFLGHAKLGAEITAAIMERLRFSNREIRMVSKMVEHHLRPGQLASGDEMPTHRAIYRYFRDLGDVGIDTLYLSLADHLATQGPELELAEWRRHTQEVGYVLQKKFEEEAVVRPPKLIDGHDLIAKFNLTPGPLIGRLLEAVHEAQAAGEVKTKEEALALAERELKDTL